MFFYLIVDDILAIVSWAIFFFNNPCYGFLGFLFGCWESGS